MIEHLHQLAAHAWHCGEHEVGRKACERLLSSPLSPDLEDKVRRNRTWYTRPLAELLPSVRHQRIEFDAGGWTLFNPSIVASGSGWAVNVRSSNYRIVDGRYVIPPEDGDRIRTRNYILKTFETTDMKCEYECTEYPVEGLEDVRLNVVNGELLASATVRNFAGLDGTCRIGVARAEVDPHRYTDLIVRPTAPDKHEKNWMPLLGRREWLYSCHTQGVVATVAEAGGEWEVTARAASPHIARGFRGGSQLVPLDDGTWLAVIHEVAMDKAKRIYEHRFVRFDEARNFAIVEVSPPFAFQEPRAIEFCAGLARKEDRVVMSYGIRDEEAWLTETSVRDVLAIMVRT